MKNGDAIQINSALQDLEALVRQQHLSSQIILSALTEAVYDAKRPVHIRNQCMISLGNLIPQMSQAQIKNVLSMVMSVIEDRQIDFKNTLKTFISLLKTDVNALVPTLIEELDEIMNADNDGIYEVRDELTIYRGERLLEAISALILQDPGHLTSYTLNLITSCLESSWENEKNRHQYGLGQQCIQSKILSETLWAASTRPASAKFIDFLIQEVQEVRDDKFENIIFPITEAALNALLQSPLKIQELIEFIVENNTDNLSYNITWLIGEVTSHIPHAIPEDSSQGLLSVLLDSLNKTKNWQQAKHVVEALGKMWIIFDSNAKEQIIEVIKNTLFGKREIIMLNFVAVQESAAWALGEIAVKGSPESR